MKIGIYDDAFYSLQERLMSEGHELYILAPGCPKINEEEFNVTCIRGSITQVMSMKELIKANCDLYITGTGNSDYAYETLKNLGFTVLGHSAEAILYETNRDLLNSVWSKLKPEQLIIPKAKEFDNRQDAIKFLKKTKKLWVLKQTQSSPQHIFTNRTVVSKDNNQVISLLNKTNAWFVGDVGGVRFEELIEGYEVSFGAWFTGTKFLKTFYSCIEHKGAQNCDRGSILTGEVGSTLTIHNLDEDSIIYQIFKSAEPMFKDKCCGMIDFNVIVKPNGKIYLLEATVRFGRPTLEMLLSRLEEKQDFGLFLHDFVKYPHGDIETTLSKIFTPGYSIGVTVFTYGNPVLDETIRNLSEAEQKIISSQQLSHEIEFYMPHVNEFNNSIKQLFCRYDNVKDVYKTTFNERQFVVIGHGETIQSARHNAYKPLKDFWLLGATWRDDVGHNYESTMELLEQYRIV